MKPPVTLLALTAVSLAAGVLLPALPQPLEYHDFADQREMGGVANFLDVTTNAGFLLVAIVGFAIVYRPGRSFERPAERWPYTVFFSGMLLTAVGSAYYHLAPDNERLFWDRLPMTIAFMSLVAAQIVERVSVRVGLLLLVPMLVIGIGTVVYWLATERSGSGNIVPYAVLQAYAVIAILLVTWVYPSRYTHSEVLYWVFAGYVVAKLFETFDRQIYGLGRVISGHSLKHLAAAVAGVFICHMLLRRTLRQRAVRDA